MEVDNIPPQLLIIAADIIADHLTNLINATMLEESIFPYVEKRASVTPVFKKDDKLLKTNYRADPSLFLTFSQKHLKDSS